jgi:hypothetical protein
VNTIDPHRVHSLVETHLDNLIADIQKELAVETGEAAARFFSGLKWEAPTRRHPSSARAARPHREAHRATCRRLQRSAGPMLALVPRTTGDSVTGASASHPGPGLGVSSFGSCFSKSTVRILVPRCEP